MKKPLFLLPLVALLAASCEKDETTSSPKPVDMTAQAVSGSDFAWTAGTQIGVFCPEANLSNEPFTVLSVDGSGNAALGGQITTGLKGGYTFYSYYSYTPINTGYEKSVSFALQAEQSTADNIAVNTFLVGEPKTADSPKGASLSFQQATASIAFEITLPSSMQSLTVQSVSLTCQDQSFYTSVTADLTENTLTFPVRGPYGSTKTLTLNVASPSAAAPGSTALAASMVVLPDDYTGKTVELVVLTNMGGYAKKVDLGTFARGETVNVAYTLDPMQWFDPDMPRISLTALPAVNPVSAPVLVDFAGMVSLGFTPAKIEMIASGAVSHSLTYTITAADLAAKVSAIQGPWVAAKPLPGTVYMVYVYNSANELLSSAPITTQAAPDMSNVQIVTSGSDLKTVLESAGRKTKLFLMPGTYPLTASVMLTADLELMADSPRNTVITSSVAMTPKGTLNLLSFSGIMWKASTGHFLRPVANATNGSFDIAELRVKSCAFDFSTASGQAGCLYFPSCSVAGGAYTGRLKAFNIDDIMHYGTASGTSPERIQAIMQVYGGDVYCKIYDIAVTNSTFSNVFGGLITLPAGAAATGVQLPLNDNRQPTITFTNNTCYKLFSDNSFASSAAAIHTGSGAESMKVLVTLRNNIFHFGGTSTYYGLLNCTYDTQDASKGSYSNNWGLDGQPYKLRGFAPGHANNPNGSGYYTPFTGMITQLLSNPMDNPLATGASFKVIGSGVTNAGDPRWK